MPEIDRLTGVSGCFELDFLEREATSRSPTKLGIRLDLAGLSLSDTVSILEAFGVDRCQSAVHNWVQKVDLKATSGANPDHVAIDETVIQLDDEQCWLYAAVDLATNRLLHVRLFPTRTTALTSMFVAELREKRRGDDALVLIDGAPWLKAAFHRHRLRFRDETHGNHNSVERVFREVKRRTNQFRNCFSHAKRRPSKTGCKRSPPAWNQLI